MSDYIEGLADRLSEAFGEPTLIPQEVKALLWDIRAESWEDGVMWKGGVGTIRPEREPNPYLKPPLELPTEPTWGIAVNVNGPAVGTTWQLNKRGRFIGGRWYAWDPAHIIDFIALTPEQVERIEAAR